MRAMTQTENTFLPIIDNLFSRFRRQMSCLQLPPEMIWKRGSSVTSSRRENVVTPSVSHVPVVVNCVEEVMIVII